MPVNKSIFRGLIAPVFTPFDASGKINHDAIHSYGCYLKDNKIGGILVNGTTGEGTSMTKDERCEVLSIWRKNWRGTIIAQVGGTNLTDVKFLAAHAEQEGVDAILCLPDLFFKPSKLEDLITYLKIVSLSAPKTPLLYYHIPDYTGVHLNMKDLLEASYEIPNFIGIKYTAEDLEVGTSCITEHLKDSVVFLGCERQFLPALSMGWKSAISTTINLFPDLHSNILRLYESKKLHEASLEQEKLNHNISEITKYGSWVSSMKGAMRKMRLPIFDIGYVRPPLTNVNFELTCLNLKEASSYA